MLFYIILFILNSANKFTTLSIKQCKTKKNWLRTGKVCPCLQATARKYPLFENLIVNAPWLPAHNWSISLFGILLACEIINFKTAKLEICLK